MSASRPSQSKIAARGHTRDPLRGHPAIDVKISATHLAICMEGHSHLPPRRMKDSVTTVAQKRPGDRNGEDHSRAVLAIARSVLALLQLERCSTAAQLILDEPRRALSTDRSARSQKRHRPPQATVVRCAPEARVLGDFDDLKARAGYSELATPSGAHRRHDERRSTPGDPRPRHRRRRADGP